jgi:hypothetical protein
MKTKTLRSFETSETDYPETQRRIPKERPHRAAHLLCTETSPLQIEHGEFLNHVNPSETRN